MKKITIFFLLICVLTISPTFYGQNWKANISGSIGLINTSYRIQAEVPLKNSFSVGVNTTFYSTKNWWPGYTIEPFCRKYIKTETSNGFFTQAKLGFGIYKEPSYISLNSLDNIIEKHYYAGVGGGIGYKYLLKNHISLEAYTGIRVYSYPSFGIFHKVENTQAVINNDIRWYLTSGFPFELNIKLGFQF